MKTALPQFPEAIVTIPDAPEIEASHPLDPFWWRLNEIREALSVFGSCAPAMFNGMTLAANSVLHAVADMQRAMEVSSRGAFIDTPTDASVAELGRLRRLVSAGLDTTKARRDEELRLVRSQLDSLLYFASRLLEHTNEADDDVSAVLGKVTALVNDLWREACLARYNAVHRFIASGAKGDPAAMVEPYQRLGVAVEVRH
jgi:hypothetical protein